MANIASAVNLHEPYKQRVARALNDKHLKTALNRSTGRMSDNRVASLAAVDGQRLRDQTRQMKEYVLRHLPDLLEQFEAQVVANGGQVHWARDGEEACAIMRQIAREEDVQKVVKSKSMATEEIHLNAALEADGLKVVETDLGEYIIQLENEPPSHIVAPVLHKRLEDISAIFHRELDIPITYDPEVLCNAARVKLREEFLSADMGVSGCNFAIADTGTVCIVTNEGNGRMTTGMPRVLVSLMGIEKIVPTVEDAFLQYQNLCRSATGQQCSVYLSMTSGPRQTHHTDEPAFGALLGNGHVNGSANSSANGSANGSASGLISDAGDPDGPEVFHVILLDNGRTHMLERGFGEALMCIRCGACLNVCPVYREIGGHAYGSTYSGPIGAVISPLLNNDVTDAEKLPHASTLCGACRDACPVKIDLPRLLLDLRHETVAEGDDPRFERAAIKGFTKSMSSRRLYEQSGKLAGLGSNVLAGLSGGNIQFMPPPLSAWTESRSFPPFAKKSFRDQWRERRKIKD